MRYIIGLIAAVFVLGVASQCARAVEVQAEVEAAWVCKNQADVEAQIDTIIATKSTEQANELLKAKIVSGDCIQSPIGPVAVTVTKKGNKREAFDFKGVRILVEAVEVDGKFWTGSVEVIAVEHKT